MGSRILLADDSITIQKVVNLTFADEGIEVIAVSNGDLAERRLNEVRPDLVLADIFMPGKNGYELCEVIKQNPLFRNVPVVLLVGAFEPFDQAEARRVQADAHLTKPFESRTLVETVRRLISESGRAITGPIAPLPSPGEGREEMHHAEPIPALATASAASKIDLAEMMDSPTAPLPTSPSRKTGELGSSLAGDRPPVFDVRVNDMPAGIAVDGSLAGASDQFDPMELASIGEFPHSEMQSSDVQGQPDMILDFDKVDPVEPSSPQAAVSFVSFEAQAGAQAEADGVGNYEVTESFNTADFDTRPVEMPPTINGWQAITTTAPLNGHTANFGMHNEVAFATSERSADSAVATMLADDPLGDLLLEETVSAGVSTFSHNLLDIELTAPAVAEPSAVSDTQFDLVETSEVTLDSDHAPAPVDDRIEDEPELRNTKGELKMSNQPDSDAAGSPADPQADFVESDDILDWTSPDAGNYKTATLDPAIVSIDASEPEPYSVRMTADITSESELDSVVPIDIGEPQPDTVMPIDILESHPDSVMMAIDTSEPQTDSPAPAENTQEAVFESARTWPEEEARFAAIDNEAFPVEEAGVASQVVTETGFSASPVTPEQPGSTSEFRAADTFSSTHTSNGASSHGELSSAMMEEIVRRVVAAMSETVVREVAWEVVPDCVERVIDQLTRESLSKRA